MAAHVAGPFSPDRKRVAVEILKVVALGPQHQQRRPETVARSPVGLLVLPVDGETGAVVLDHRAYHAGVPRGLPPLVVVLMPHCFGVTVVPAVGVRTDYPLGNLWLSVEEPVPPASGEFGGDPGQVLADRDAVQQREA